MINNDPGYILDPEEVAEALDRGEPIPGSYSDSFPDDWELEDYEELTDYSEDSASTHDRLLAEALAARGKTERDLEVLADQLGYPLACQKLGINLDELSAADRRRDGSPGSSIRKVGGEAVRRSRRRRTA